MLHVLLSWTLLTKNEMYYYIGLILSAYCFLFLSSEYFSQYLLSIRVTGYLYLMWGFNKE